MTEIVELTGEQTWHLRRVVLRDGRMDADVDFPEDHLAGAWHLGARLDQAIVGVSSWSPSPWPDELGDPAVQLRGMAVLGHLQGRGIGRDLVLHGMEQARQRGAVRLWANARDAVMDFYLGLGATIVGEGFTTAATGLPHHRIVWML